MPDGDQKSKPSLVRMVEIEMEPGKSLGFHIRVGDGWQHQNGVFVTQVDLGSAVETNGLLSVGDEIVRVNSVDVTMMSLVNVVVVMQCAKRMVLTVKTLT